MKRCRTRGEGQEVDRCRELKEAGDHLPCVLADERWQHITVKGTNIFGCLCLGWGLIKVQLEP